MKRMMVIADDLTGALDTGVQFAGSKTVFVTTADKINEGKPADILVVDTESRHLSAEEAYRIVYRIVDCACKRNFQWIYKKTDSLLRGNLGAELAAALDASGRKKLIFVPSYPRMRRIVKNGCLFVDGIPVTHTRNARDMLDPIATSMVGAVVAEQTDLPVRLADLAREDFNASGEKEILISDAVTDGDMLGIAQRMLPHMQDIVMSGCAGFASALKKYIAPAPVVKTTGPKKDARGHLIICGSINERARRQINYASEKGVPVIVLMPEEYLGEFYSGETIRVICAKIQEFGAALVCTARNGQDMDRSNIYAKEHRLSDKNLHVHISKRLGGIASAVVNAGNIDVLSVIGGDTLFGIMSAFEGQGFIPVREIYEGTVQSEMVLRSGGSMTILTKAGSFGDDSAIWRMHETVISG